MNIKSNTYSRDG